MPRYNAFSSYQPPQPEREEDGFVLLAETASERNAVRPGSCANQDDLPPSYEMTMSMGHSDRPPDYCEHSPGLPSLQGLSFQDQYTLLTPSYPRTTSRSNSVGMERSDEQWAPLRLYSASTTSFQDSNGTTFMSENSGSTTFMSDNSGSTNQFMKLSSRLLLQTGARSMDIPVLAPLDLSKYDYDFSLEKSFLRDSEAEDRIGTLVEISSSYDAGWSVASRVSSDVRTDVLEISGFG